MFILDESNMLESGFLERMNTLLANGEVRKGGTVLYMLRSPQREWRYVRTSV